MTTTKQYDYLNRLLSISSSPSSSSSLPISYAYGYNDANQRTRVALNDGSFWIYQYDALGQVTSGKKYFSDNTPVPGQQFEYGFDDIGNRTSAKAGGDQSGTGLRPVSYSANSLNQYTNRTVPNAIDVLGIANAAASVTVNSSAADYRRGEYFQELVSVSNSSTSVWQNVSVTTSGGGTNTGNVFVPTATETYRYDADGNMTNDGRWSFTWDAENRLLSMQALSAAPSGAKKKLDFSYDYQGRRIQKIVSTWNGSSYVAASTNRFLYDGWNLIAELNGTNGLIRSYLWGLDLSGSMQGAGGVGGLLAIKPASGNPSFVAYDGNGNVTGLIDATTGTTSGQFEYGPFGETIRLTPNSNNQSPFRFSTKYADDESDFLYYGFRYYNPSTGRWLSRDPVDEDGGLNLYGFVANHPIDATDLYGNRIVSIQRNCKIFIGLWITVYYENNDEKKKFDIMKEALRIQQSIDKHWNVPDDWTVGCCKVRFVVTVTADSRHTWALPSMGWGAKGMNTIELTSRPIRSGTEKSSVKGLWYSGAEDWTFAHEAGHVMSLDDDYREVDFGMGPIAFPRLGHEGHMMADYSGAVDQHEVEDVLRLNNIKCECGQ